MQSIAILLDVLFPPRERARSIRSISYERLSGLVHPIRIPSTEPAAVSLLPYRDHLVQAVITEAKFHDARHAQEALGGVLAAYLLEEAFVASMQPYSATILIPVPLSRERLRERGYNQAERICKAAVRTLERYRKARFATVPEISIDTTLLLRSRDTTPQTELGGRARRTNLQDAFQVARPPDPHTLYMLVDDVITTGATLSVAGAALHAAGAANILAIALAHSP